MTVTQSGKTGPSLVLQRGSDGPVPVGSRLSGTVRITSATPRRCAKVVVEVWYSAFMPDRNGDLFETVDRTEMLQHGELHGDVSLPFDLDVGWGPISGHDKAMTISYRLEARICWPHDEEDLVTRQTVEVVPRRVTAPRSPFASMGPSAQSEALAAAGLPAAEQTRILDHDLQSVLEAEDRSWRRMQWLYRAGLAGLVPFGVWVWREASTREAWPEAGLLYTTGVLSVVVPAFLLWHALRPDIRALGPRKLKVSWSGGPRRAWIGDRVRSDLHVVLGPHVSHAELSWELRYVLYGFRQNRAMGRHDAPRYLVRGRETVLESGQLTVEGVLDPVPFTSLVSSHRGVTWAFQAWLTADGHTVHARHAFEVLPLTGSQEVREPTPAPVAVPEPTPSSTPQRPPRDVLVRRAVWLLARMDLHRREDMAAAARNVLAWTLPVALWVPLIWLGDSRWIRDEVLAMTWVLGTMGYFWSSLVFLPAMVIAGAWKSGEHLLAAPTRLAQWMGERPLRAELTQHGLLRARDWTGLRAWSLDRMLKEEPGFVLADGVVRPLADLTPGTCPSCGGPLDHAEAGRLHCRFCDYSAFYQPPARSEALDRAHAMLAEVCHLGSGTMPTLREAFTRLLRRRHPQVDGAFRIGGVSLVALAALTAVIRELITRDLMVVPDPLPGPMVFAAVIISLLLMGASTAFSWSLIVSLRCWLLDFHEASSDYVHALHDEVLRTVGTRGAMTVAELAQHLRVREPLVRRVVSQFQRSRQLPIHLDTDTDTVSSLLARGLDDNLCTACGARTVVISWNQARCTSCDALQTVRLNG